MITLPLDYLIVVLPLLPFAAIGIFKIAEWIIETIRVRNGWIQIIKKLPNDRIKSFWVKPEGNTIKVDFPELGIKIEQELKLGKDWIYYDGNVPIAFFDENNNQIQLSSALQTISRTEVGKIAKLSFLAGKTVAQFFTEKYVWIAIVVIILVGIGIAAFNWWQFNQFQTSIDLKLASWQKTTLNKISDLLKNATLPPKIQYPVAG